MEFYSLTIQRQSIGSAQQMIVFGDVKENLFSATKLFANERLVEFEKVMIKSRAWHKHVELFQSLVPIVEALYADGFFDDVFDSNVDTSAVSKKVTVHRQGVNYAVLLENVNHCIQQTYDYARNYEVRMNVLMDKVARCHEGYPSP